MFSFVRLVLRSSELRPLFATCVATSVDFFVQEPVDILCSVLILLFQTSASSARDPQTAIASICATSELGCPFPLSTVCTECGGLFLLQYILPVFQEPI